MQVCTVGMSGVRLVRPDAQTGWCPVSGFPGFPVRSDTSESSETGRGAQTSTISGRHLEEPSTSTYVSVSNFLHFFSCKCLKNEPFCRCVCVCIYIYIYIYISTYDSAFFQHMILVFWGFSPVINRYIFDISIDICREPCRHSTSIFADI